MASVFHVSSLIGEVIVVSCNKNGECEAAALLGHGRAFTALTNGYEGGLYGYGGPSWIAYRVTKRLCQGKFGALAGDSVTEIYRALLLLPNCIHQ